MKTTDILLDHIRQLPGCVSSEIYDAMEKVDDRKNISSMLSALTKRKLVTREEFFGKDNRKMFKYWIAGAEPANAEPAKNIAVTPDRNYPGKVIAVKETRQEKEKVKNIADEIKDNKKEEVYFVITDQSLSFPFFSYEEAKESALDDCAKYDSSSIVKVVKSFKKITQIVEE